MWKSYLGVLSVLLICAGCADDASNGGAPSVVASAATNGNGGAPSQPQPVEEEEPKPVIGLTGEPMPSLDAPMSERYRWAAREQNERDMRIPRVEVEFLEQEIAKAKEEGKSTRIDERRKQRFERQLEKLEALTDDELPEPELTRLMVVGSLGFMPSREVEVFDVEGDDMVLAKATFVEVGMQMMFRGVKREMGMQLWIRGIATDGLSQGDTVSVPKLVSIVGKHPYTDASDVTLDRLLGEMVDFDPSAESAGDETAAEEVADVDATTDDETAEQGNDLESADDSSDETAEGEEESGETDSETTESAEEATNAESDQAEPTEESDASGESSPPTGETDDGDEPEDADGDGT